MEMEIKQLSRQLEAKLARTEIMYVCTYVCMYVCMRPDWLTDANTQTTTHAYLHRDITQLQNQKMKAVESSVLGLMDEKAQRLQHKLHDELEKVLQQLYNIQQVRRVRALCIDMGIASPDPVMSFRPHIIPLRPTHRPRTRPAAWWRSASSSRRRRTWPWHGSCRRRVDCVLFIARHPLNQSSVLFV